MESNLKKLLSIFAVVCFSTSSAYAYDDEDSKSPARSSVPPGKHYGGEDGGPNVMISAAYTLWTAREDGLATATSTHLTTANASITEGKVFYPDWKVRSGFKVDLGVLLDHDGWDLLAQYTWFYNKKNNLVNQPFTLGEAVSTWAVNQSQSALRTNRNKWDIWFNRIDLMLSRVFYTGHYMDMKAFLGLVGAWDKQHFDIDYVGSTGSADDEYKWRNQQDWWGVGPYAGVCPTYIFGPADSDSHFSVFLDSGIALPWSKANALMRQYYDDTTTSADMTNLDSSRNVFWGLAPMVELALGLRWETWFENNWNFLLQAAWENQVWFSHNHMINKLHVNNGPAGSYVMQGLTIKAVIGF